MPRPKNYSKRRTIRLSTETDNRLVARAEKAGNLPAEMARDIIDKELQPKKRIKQI